MSVELNHTIVPAHDPEASARFLARILDLAEPEPWGPFIVLDVGNGLSLDFVDAGEREFDTHHYAFLVSDDEFDPIFERIKASGAPWYADPHHTQPQEINHHWGGRGVYFDDPDGHNLEVITRPYGSTSGG
jgi:catechol 2,3-dioxygenase-like lactoylglutathione lyase family enzyme